MADTLDVLTLAEGRAAIGQDPSTTDTALDTQLELYITATSRWIDSVCGRMVTRTVAELAANTTANTLTLDSATPAQLADLLEQLGSCVDIGTAAAPTVIAASRQLEAVDTAAGTVTISGEPVTTTDAHSVRQGLYVNTAGVDPVVKLGASAHLRWLWAVERGAASRNFDDFGNVGETIAVPRRVLDILGDFYRPGVA